MKISNWTKMLLIAVTAASTMAVSAKPAEARWHGGYGYGYGWHRYHGGGFGTGFGLGAAVGGAAGLIGGALIGDHPHYYYPGYYSSYPAYSYPVPTPVSVQYVPTWY